MSSSFVDLLEDAGLTGRGGAGFGTAVKVRAAMSAGACSSSTPATVSTAP